jgi:hypothetical protein
MNIITNEQWNSLIFSVETHATTNNIASERVYVVQQTNGSSGIYDNYDHCYSPGLCFEKGMLYAWSNSEQEKAPINFSTGEKIAENFFNEIGSETAEDIVCNYVMDAHASS